MSEKIEKQLMSLHDFTFDGDTGRTLTDLNKVLEGAGYIKDSPFAMPSWVENENKPTVVNSYLDPEGKRVHIVWNSEDSGLSHVVNIILDAPPLARKKAVGACGTCQGIFDPLKEFDTQA